MQLQLVFRPSDVLPEQGSAHSSVDLFLPTWTPGSYLIREFSRHVGRVVAHDADTGSPLRCQKTAKNRFRVEFEAAERPVRVAWTVYAHELSVRTADLTAEHAYWNHACLLLWPTQGRHLPARLTITFPGAWDLACALPADESSREEGTAAPERHVTLRARDFDHAIDSPCLLGRFQRLDWVVAGVPHAVVLEGLGPVGVPQHLVRDLQAVVERAAAVFDGRLPYARYVFLCLFAADGHGGLEHADSTTLLMGRTALTTEKGYRDFVSLAAHELFHAWNVKRLRPAEFWQYDYENENYTEFLWLIEGWTAYYDDLLCLRAGVLTRQQYLEVVGKNIDGMLAAPGRLRLSLRESSFDAWIRLYRPDENTRNSSQNYYGNGAVAAMCLDLWIRRQTQGSRSLDDVLRALYEATFRQSRGYRLEDVHRALQVVSGDAAPAFLETLVADRLEPALQDLFAAFGIRLRFRETERAWLGVHFESASTVVAAVIRGSPAFDAGLHPGDEVLAVEDLRVDASRWPEVWQALAKVGKRLTMLFARRGIVGRCEVVPQASPGTAALEVDDSADPSAKQLLTAWLPEVARPQGTEAQTLRAAGA